MTRTPSLKQRANYVKQRLTPHLGKEEDAQVRRILECLTIAIDTEDSAVMEWCEQEAQRYAYAHPKPLSLRLGAIKHELDARCDGSDADYRRIIVKCLMDYFKTIDAYIHAHLFEPAHAYAAYTYYYSKRAGQGKDFAINFLYDHYMGPDTFQDSFFIDAIERAHRLVQAGESVEQALREVGLVK